MFQMLNAAGIFSKSGIYDAFFYKMGYPVISLAVFQKCQNRHFDVFLTFFDLFSSKMTIFDTFRTFENG
tara:strand:- start:340 stop:546 length:207 start_codon:yes stop_codon:yes gene_type:complete